MQIKPQYVRAIIYCRVSSQQQVDTGHGLDSQEQRCIQRAKDLDLEVAAIFPDGAISGGLFDRPAMSKLIAFLDTNREEKFVVIFDDLKRFARDVAVHLQLKTELVTKRKVKLECLNFRFEDSPTGRFIETVMAGAAQLEREQNREQVMNKMKARLEAGYWPFCPPPALKQVNGVLQPVEPFATIHKTAIEGYKNGFFNNQEAVRQFLTQQYQAHGISRPVALHGTKEILSEILYCGYVEYKPWEVARRKATHEGFISYETYLRVQDMMKERAKPRTGKDYTLDFGLRRYVLCGECQNPYTGAWWTNRQKNKYAYYICKRCRISVQRSQMEKDFLIRLREAEPPAETCKMAEIIIKDIFSQHNATRLIPEFLTTTQAFWNNPVRRWEMPDIYQKRLLLEMYFPDKLIYHKKEGWLDSKNHLILEGFRHPDSIKTALVEMGSNWLDEISSYLFKFAPRAKAYICPPI